MNPRWNALPAILIASSAGPGCDVGDTSTSTRVPPAAARASLLDGPGVSVTVRVDPNACSATAQCRDAFLPGPTGRLPSLTTSLACRAGQSDVAYPRDSLIAFARRVRCYQQGDPMAPGTWQPEGGLEAGSASLGEMTWGQVVPPYGDIHLDSAVRLDVAEGFAFCRYEAWGSLLTSAVPDEPRTVRHQQGALVVGWDVFIEPAATGAYQCVTSEAVTMTRIAATVHGLPSPQTPGALPASHDTVLLIEEDLATAVGAGVVNHAGARLVMMLGTPFPPSDSMPLGTFDERALWVTRDSIPLDTVVERSCAETQAASGALSTIAVVLADLDGVSIGGILIHSEVDGRRFDCDRESATGACLLLDLDTLGTLAPCLWASGP